MKKNILLKIISIIVIIIPIIMICVFENSAQTKLDNGHIYFNVNWALLVGLEIINIAIIIFVFTRKEKIKNIYITIIFLYIIASAFVPVYHIQEIIIPTGPNAYLMGMGMTNVYKDIYGIDISSIIKAF